MLWSFEHGMVVRSWGDGPVLVWIHGLGEQSASFDGAAHALDGFTHVLVDMPGYGRSPWPALDRPKQHAVIGQAIIEGEPQSSLETFANELAAWLATRPPAVLVGHSMGGVLATLVAERSDVRGVVNIEGNLSRGDCAFSSQALPFSIEDFEARGFQEMRDRVYEAGVTDMALRTYYAALCMASPRQFHCNAVDLVRLSEGETLVARYAKLHCRTLYIAGVPRGICERSRELLDREGVPWIALAPSGHWPVLDQREAFVRALADFVRAV